MINVSELVLRFSIGFGNAFLAGLNYWQYKSFSGTKDIQNTFAIQCFINALSAFYLIVGIVTTL